MQQPRPARIPRPPWFSFPIGGSIAVVLVTPLLALATAQTAGAPAGHALRLTAALTGLLSFFVGGGVARGVSDGVHLGRSQRVIILRAAGELAVAGSVLAIIVRVAYGVPEHLGAWPGFVLLGALAAAPAGAAIAVVSAFRVRRMLARGKLPLAAPAKATRDKAQAT